MLKFLYEVITQGLVDGEVYVLTFEKTTAGKALSRSVLLPAIEIDYEICFSYDDGVTYGDWISVIAQRPVRIPIAATHAKVRGELAALNNQELIKDGGVGDFDATKDSLHDIREYLETASSGLSPSITGTHTITPAHGLSEQTITTITPTRNLEFEIYFDVSTLITAGDGGLLTFRLNMEVDGITLRTIDNATFQVGTDEIYPVLNGYSDIGTNTLSITVQCSSVVTGFRVIKYKILGGIS